MKGIRNNTYKTVSTVNSVCSMVDKCYYQTDHPTHKHATQLTQNKNICKELKDKGSQVYKMGD